LRDRRGELRDTARNAEIRQEVERGWEWGKEGRSESRDCRETRQRIAEELRGRGYNPWLDTEEIAPGQRWAPSILQGLANSAVALLLVSKNLDMKTSFVQSELEMAMKTMSSRDESSSPVIPIKLDDAPLPQEVEDVHWLDLREENAFDHLERGLKRILGSA
jgi:hypothetical protein